jgi:hypothetical protein
MPTGAKKASGRRRWFYAAPDHRESQIPLTFRAIVQSQKTGLKQSR